MMAMKFSYCRMVIIIFIFTNFLYAKNDEKALLKKSPDVNADQNISIGKDNNSKLIPIKASVKGADIQFTNVPICGSDANLAGTVSGVDDLNAYHIAVYIFNEGSGWFTKPYYSQPCTSIDSGGTWTCDITTGDCDGGASDIAAFLLPINVECPIVAGSAVLPQALYSVASAYAKTHRDCCPEINFAGYRWKIKAPYCLAGPGPNMFSCDNVRLDSDGLHFKISYKNSKWTCAEAYIDNYLGGYGQYIFNIKGRVDLIDPNMVVGLFTWDNDYANYFRELDIEFSKWSDAQNPANAQFVAQPWSVPENIFRFNVALSDTEDELTVILCWQNSYADFAVYKGIYTNTFPSNKLISRWKYSGASLPQPGNEHIRVNFWLNEGRSPGDNIEREFVLKNFIYLPDCNLPQSPTPTPIGQNPATGWKIN